MLNKILLTALEKTGKSVKWYKFALEGQNGGWRFLPNKDAQWLALEKVAKKVAKKLPQYTEGQIVDKLASLVNRSEILV